MKPLVTLLAILLLPALAPLLIYTFSFVDALINLAVVLLMTMLILSCNHLKGRLKTVTLNTIIILYISFIFTVLFESVLFDFTGRGFNEEVFFHFELESVRIAFNEYPLILGLFFILSAVFIWLVNNTAKKIKLTTYKYTAITSLLLLLPLMSQSVIARLGYTLQEFLQNQSKPIQPEDVNKMKQVGVINDINLTSKINLNIKNKSQAKNLILLYLESFNYGLINPPQYPELTPNLNQLNDTMYSLDLMSSAYVTIEGIISSQCGTMLPMDSGNNTFLTNGELMNKMPCLGDVLKEAGYQQYYLGGAAMEFAGKGRFLESHGYDHIMGWEHWRKNGYQQDKGVWGLSDTSLFEEAIKTIKEAAKNPPYNVTMLTLGTHLPGYVYDGCQPYGDSQEPFINAIHCTDHLVGQFIEKLNTEKLLDNTVLMVVADHGIFPTPKMTELFGDIVQNRKLLAISNHQPLETSSNILAGYDLAPTLLDWMSVQHNASFLYGRSINDDSKPHQKYATRYLDWNDGELVSNPKGACTQQKTPEWPLNSCDKKQLINLTNQVLSRYSTKDEAEDLSCQLEVSWEFKQGKTEPEIELMLNNEDHYHHFHHEGYLLNSLKLTTGVLLFKLNENNQITGHHYFKDEVNSIKKIQPLIHNKRYLVLIKSRNDEFLSSIGADTNTTDKVISTVTNINQPNISWSKSPQINLCHQVSSH